MPDGWIERNPTNNIDPRPFMAKVCECNWYGAQGQEPVTDFHELPRADFIRREGNLFGGALRNIIGGGRVMEAGVRSPAPEVWKRGEDVDFSRFGVVDAVVASRTREIIDAKKYGGGR